MTNPLQAGVDHAELRRLAEAATTGPWAYMGDEYADNGGKFYCVESADQETVFGEYGPGPEDARYVAAANPAVMIALLNEIDALRAAPVLPDRGWRLRYASVRGETLAEMKSSVLLHPIHQIGDAVLVWVNEGDLYQPGVHKVPERPDAPAEGAE